MADDEIIKALTKHYGPALLEREQDHTAAPLPPPGDPSLYQGEIRNLPDRPQDYMMPVAESLSPTMGGYGTGQLLAQTYGNLKDREWAKAAETGLPLLGIFAGPGARTADLSMMARAHELAKSGATRDAVWKETGWFQGPDQKWRYEIPDNDARLTNAAGRDLYDVGETYGTAMRSGLMHPEFFEAYPSAKAIAYRYSLDPSMKHPEGAFRPDSHLGSMREILPGGEGVMDIDAPSLPDITDVGLHELQHYVQGKEDFSPGANPHVLAQEQSNAIAALPDAVATYDGLRREQDAARHRGDTEWVDALESHVSQARDIANTLMRLAQGNPYEKYARAFGELEARNVQRRRALDDEQRKARPPWETEREDKYGREW